MSGFSPDLGIILVDHGSTKAEANDLLLEVVELFRRHTGAQIVEAAHMELAKPDIGEAFRRCVEQGAKRVVVHPYFLAPGQHSTTDIPRLAAEAGQEFAGIEVTVTAPLGCDEAMGEIVARRIREALDPRETPRNQPD